MRRWSCSSWITALVALAVSVGATGCSRPSRTPVKEGASEQATASVETTPSGEATSSAASEQAEDPQQAPADASGVIRELEAIERELSGMDLPSETDFDALEGEIR